MKNSGSCLGKRAGWIGNPASRQRRKVVPVELLGEVKDLAESEDELVLVERPRATAAVPGATKFEDKAAIGTQDAVNLLSERPDPFDILRCCHIAVRFLPPQGE